jgi:hypothetical protein
MIELNSDTLNFSFPEVHPEAKLSVNFQRTLRIPDDGRKYPLPPGLGNFPLRHIDDHAEKIPESWLRRGGVLLPMWQSEALWISFRSEYVPERDVQYPFAIKIATGKINAINGKSWEKGLHRNPQSYLIVPVQPWLDGYCVEKGVIRQFIAMPLGQGYTAEEQITGNAEFGGLQIEVFPMKREDFDKRFPPGQRRGGMVTQDGLLCCISEASMGLAPGGRMRQEIFEDPYSIHDWDKEHVSRTYVHLVNSVGWSRITAEKPPTKPFTIQEYSRMHFPWFEYYDPKAEEIAGSKILAELKSVKEMGEEKGESPLPDNASALISTLLKIGKKPTKVREGKFD